MRHVAANCGRLDLGLDCSRWADGRLDHRWHAKSYDCGLRAVTACGCRSILRARSKLTIQRFEVRRSQDFSRAVAARCSEGCVVFDSEMDVVTVPRAEWQGIKAELAELRREVRSSRESMVVPSSEAVTDRRHVLKHGAMLAAGAVTGGMAVAVSQATPSTGQPRAVRALIAAFRS